MKTNKSIHYALIGALILFTLISIAVGDKNYQTTTTTKTPPVKNCAWSENWGDWSECKNGFQTRTKPCSCGNLKDDKDDKGGYKRGVPNYSSGGYTVTLKDEKEEKGEYNHATPNSGYSSGGYSVTPQPKEPGKQSSADSGYSSGGYTVTPKPKDSGKQSSGDYTVTQPKGNDNSGKQTNAEDSLNTCSGEQPTEKRACTSTPPPTKKTRCEWSDWGEFSECSKSCGGGVKTRTRECKCVEEDCEPEKQPNTDYSSGSDVKSGYGSDSGSKTSDHSYSNNVYKRNGGGSTEVYSNNNQCSGLTQDTLPCNTQPCETEEPCDKVPAPEPKAPSPEPRQPAPEPSPENPPPEENCPVTETNCKWDSWSEWTKCDKFCKGQQFRRQLCVCPGDDNETCSDSYNDALCLGTPLTEKRLCNSTENGDLCANTWGFFEDEWSPCMSENHYCGEGTQWRRQFCLGVDGSKLEDSDCLYTNEVPLFETRECTMEQSCCEFGEPTMIECDALRLVGNNNHDSACVIPWSERECMCGNTDGTNTTSGNSTFSQCVWTNSLLENPPISFDLGTHSCPTNSTRDEIGCREYASNGTCLFFTVVIDSGEVTSVKDFNLTDTGDCFYSTPNCWDTWTDWSPCAGTCDEAYQWRRQTTSKSLADCRSPPSFEYRECNLTNCCEWVFDNEIEWSNCSAPCGEGIQMRFPYTCSCDEDYQCPPPEEEWEMRDCQLEDDAIDCCLFDVETEATLCDVSSGESWYTQKCICEGDSEDGPSCDISSCYGVPDTFTNECQCPEIPSENPSENPSEIPVGGNNSTNTTLRVLSVESWKTATWPEANETKSRNFSGSCSKDTWFEVINKTDYNDWDTLAAEYIAAHLNILSGAVSQDEISTNLSSVETLLSKCPWTDEQKSESDQLIQNLRLFNKETYANELESSDEASANSQSANDAATAAIIIWTVIPSVLALVIVVLLVGLSIFIQKKRATNEAFTCS